MKNYKRQHFFLLMFFFVSSLQITTAQDLNIAGDTIYVNAEAEVMVRFPTLPTFYNTIPSDAPYNLKTAGTGFTIVAKTERTKPAPLFVNEGGRNHKFVIVFKKNIDYNNEEEIDYDYSTTKKIEQHIRESVSLKLKESSKEEIVKPEEKKDKKKKNVKPDENTAANYYVLLEEGDNNIKNKDYKAAKLNFEKALALRPADEIPKQRLNEIRIRIADQDKTNKQENNKQYVETTAAAKSYFAAKKYALAQEQYKKALALKPGDLIATNQLAKISKLINDENNNKDDQKLNDIYKGYIATGEKALKKNELADARIAYEQALIIKQNDPVAVKNLKIISDKELKQKEIDDQEINYNNIIVNAGKLFTAGNYEAAKTEYTKALALFKRPWPQEQIKNINNLIAIQSAKDNADKQKRINQSAAVQKGKEKANLETNYNTAVKAADNYFKAKDYTNAVIAYNKALSITKKPWPQEQLKTIQKIRDEEEAEKKKLVVQEETKKQAKERIKKEEKEKQALLKQYKAAVQDADKLFKKKDYLAAKEAYVKAAGLSNESWPQEQIQTITKIIDEQTAKENAEKQRLAQEAELTAKYVTIIDKAKIEFDKGNYSKASKLFSEAAILKPTEKLPKEKLNLIQATLDQIAAAEKAKKDSIAAIAELKKKYTLAMSKAKSYYLKNDLVNAKGSYTDAAYLKPGEAEPKNQLKAIQTKLDALALANELNDKYEQNISMGDSLLIAKAYEKAIVSYNEALKLKPAEYYPQAQIKYIQADIRNEQKEKEDREKMEAYRKEEELDKKFRDAIKRANKAVTDKKYDVAKAAYTEVLSIRPDNEYAQQRLKIVNYQLEKEKPAKIKEPDVKKADEHIVTGTKKKDKEVNKKDKKITDPALMKVTPVPYSAAELKAKYPNIDFNALPPEQPFNEGAVNSFENATIFRDVLLENPRLNISAADNKIKLTCQGINFQGVNTYVKFLIQNNDKSDFLTGAMMLTWIKKSGNSIKLYPVYLFPAFLPVIPPGNEAVIIYVCKSYYITENEKLNFELTDRLNKVKLEITIPGSKYAEEEGR